MLFNSGVFLFIFLPLVLPLYFYLAQQSSRAANIFLLIASLSFYSFYSPTDLPILLISILFNYTLARILQSLSNSTQSIKRGFLVFGIGMNLAFLAYFKYANFFIENINYAFTSNIEALSIALPLGISFFTFTQIAYLVDLYKQKEITSSSGLYALFVCYFPHLLAGPIVYHKDLIAELSDKLRKKINWDNISQGIFLLAIGLFKKVFIADKFSFYVEQGFLKITALSMFEAWFVALAYTIQIYFDFSGYTDMALGISQMFNIKLPQNFNTPYKSQSLQEFWQRWHMTLGSYFRNYVYIPLGGNRCSILRTITNTLVTFLLSGLWHGAAWTFLIWGGLHGAGISIGLLWKKHALIRINTFFAWLVTFLFVVVSWVFFRASSITDAFMMLKAMIGIQGLFNSFTIQAPTLWNKYAHLVHNISDGANIVAIPKLCVVLASAIFFSNSIELRDRFKPNIWSFIGTLTIFSIVFFYLGRYSEFLYFRF